MNGEKRNGTIKERISSASIDDENESVHFSIKVDRVSGIDTLTFSTDMFSTDTKFEMFWSCLSKNYRGAGVKQNDKDSPAVLPLAIDVLTVDLYRMVGEKRIKEILEDNSGINQNVHGGDLDSKEAGTPCTQFEGTLEKYRDCLESSDGIVFCLFGKPTGAGAALKVTSALDVIGFAYKMVERAHADKDFEYAVREIHRNVTAIVSMIDDEILAQQL